MEVYSRPSLEEGFQLLLIGKEKRVPGITVSSPSGFGLFMNAKNRLFCTSCGVKATHWRIERGGRDMAMVKAKRFVMNLYATGDNGTEILLTQDHILPASMGGSTRVSNLRVMCTSCNGRRGNYISFDDMVAILKLPEIDGPDCLPNSYKLKNQRKSYITAFTHGGMRLMDYLIEDAANLDQLILPDPVISKKDKKKLLQEARKQEATRRMTPRQKMLCAQLPVFEMVQFNCETAETNSYRRFNKKIRRYSGNSNAALAHIIHLAKTLVSNPHMSLQDG